MIEACTQIPYGNYLSRIHSECNLELTRALNGMLRRLKEPNRKAGPFTDDKMAKMIAAIKPGILWTREMSIIVVTIGNFDSLARQLDTHIFFDLVNKYLTALMNPIRRHGGIVYDLAQGRQLTAVIGPAVWGSGPTTAALVGADFRLEAVSQRSRARVVLGTRRHRRAD